MTLHPDAFDVEYGVMLALGEDLSGLPDLWEGQGISRVENREDLIMLRELRAVRLLLHWHFTEYFPG